MASRPQRDGFNQDDLLSMLDKIPVTELSYDEWLHVGMALHYEGMPCSMWEQWSQCDKRFHAGECEKKWKSFGKNSGSSVTGATISRMAQDRGWMSPSGIKTYEWDDIIPDNSSTDRSDDIDNLPLCPEVFDPVDQMREYLNTLFEPEDKIAYSVKVYKDKDNKYKPCDCICSRSCQDLLNSLDKHPESISDTIGSYNKDAGAWICFNPVDGNGRSNSNVTAWRYALVESDSVSVDDQWRLLHTLKLPIAIVVNSGGKSLHAIVRIDAKDADEYNQRVDALYKYCSDHDFPIDKANKNSARLSRLPGVQRGENKQYIVCGAMGPRSWAEWQRVVLNPLPIMVFDGRWDQLPPLKEELIHGILRRKHKMILVGGSKVGKSFNLIQLAVCIAEGQSWLGHECEKGRVLYINLEIDEASFDHRVEKVYKALNLTPSGLLEAVTLRGQEVNIITLSDLIPKETYTAIIIDPFYKLGVEDENAAGDVGKFCRTLDNLSEKTGAAIIYCHHHSKGMQSQKNATDRGSGSGVFARDADAIVDILELSMPKEYEAEIKEKYGEWCIPCQMDFTLREFVRIKPIMCIYSYPIIYMDKDGYLEDAKAADLERSLAAGRAKGALQGQIERDVRLSQLKNMVKRDREFGKVKTMKEYAAELGVTERTVQRYKEQDEDLLALYHGYDMT